MIKKKLLVTFMTSTLLLSLFTGCGGNNNTKETTNTTAPNNNNATTSKTENKQPDKVVDLEFWGWWSSEARKPHIEEAVNRFNQSQDKYKVTYVNLPFGDIFTKNIAQIAAGKPTDAIANTMEEVIFRADQGQVESISKFLNNDPETANAFYKQYMDVLTGDDGNIYALPFSVDTRVIYYNKDQFTEVGLNPENPPKTWDELRDAAYKLDIKQGNKFDRVGFLPLLGNGGIDSWICNANKGQIWYDKDENPTVDTPINRDVFKWIDEFVQHYGRDVDNELSAVFKSGMQDPFSSGKLSMIVQTSSYTSYLTQTNPDLNYGVMKMPEYKPGNGHAINGGGFVLEIPKGAKNIEGSYEFIKFMTGKETQEFLSSKLGDFSARNDFDKNSEFFKIPIRLDIAKALEETQTSIRSNRLQGYSDVIKPLIDEGALGIKSTDDALANAQKAFENFLK